MSSIDTYDHVMVMTSDIRTDRRMLRCARTLSKIYPSQLIVSRDRGMTGDVQIPGVVINYIHCRFASGPLFYAEFTWRVVNLLRRAQFRQLTCVDFDTLLIACYFKTRGTIRTFFDAHEYFPEVPELIRRPLKRWIWNTLGRRCIPKIDVCYTVSQSLARELSSRYGVSFQTLRNLPEKNHLLPVSKDSEELKLVYLGVLNIGRGLEQALAAIATMDNVTLDLIGEGDLSADLRYQVQELNLSHRVRFHGWVAPSAIMEILSDKNLGLNLLDDASQSYRLSLANKFFDYIQAGLPVLTMNFEEYRRLNEDYGIAILLESLELKEVQSTLKRIINNKSLLKALATKCLAARNILHWNRAEATLLRMHQE